MEEKKSDSKTYTESELKLYPDRKAEGYQPTFWQKLISKDEKYYDAVCQHRIRNAFKNNPLVKTLVKALKKSGCPINLRRHVVCETCDPKVVGGFDCEYNQIVICKNAFRVTVDPEMVLVHELIHMYDHCANHIDFKNLEHLACTEIRASNLVDCNFLHSYLEGQSSVFNIKKTHQYCVKMKAAESMRAVRNVDFPTAAKYIYRVFDRCYNDLEPFGRRIRRNKPDAELSEKETKHFNLYET